MLIKFVRFCRLEARIDKKYQTLEYDAGQTEDRLDDKTCLQLINIPHARLKDKPAFKPYAEEVVGKNVKSQTVNVETKDIRTKPVAKPGNVDVDK